MESGAGTGTRPFGPPLEAEAMPTGLLGMYFFLASEAMFFVGLLGSFVVLESAGGQHALFVHSSAMLSKGIGWLGVVCLIAASALIKLGRAWLNVASLGAAVLFLILQAAQCMVLLQHHTFVYRTAQGVFVADGSTTKARPISMPQPFEIHSITAADFTNVPVKNFTISPAKLLMDLNYGPSRNNFFACYFLFTAVHIVHLIAGMIALSWFLLRTKVSGSSEYLGDQRLVEIPRTVQIYWHFVNAVGVIGFAVLYFV